MPWPQQVLCGAKAPAGQMPLLLDPKEKGVSAALPWLGAGVGLRLREAWPEWEAALRKA